MSPKFWLRFIDEFRVILDSKLLLRERIIESNKVSKSLR